MKLTVAGCGDAFGSGGRLQTCFHVDLGVQSVLIDCGATSLIGLERCGLDPGRVGTILISHLHGDHFSGLVWWYLHAVHVARRRQPLTVVGPAGIEQRFEMAMEALFAGSLQAKPPFEMRFIEQRAGERLDSPAASLGGPAFSVTAFEVQHPSGAPSHALRLEAGGKTLAFSGDTEWVEPLVACAKGADLFLCECYAFDQPTRYHMCWSTLAAQLPRIGARRVVLTHMSAAMLENGAAAIAGRREIAMAQDGMVIEI